MHSRRASRSSMHTATATADTQDTGTSFTYSSAPGSNAVSVWVGCAGTPEPSRKCSERWDEAGHFKPREFSRAPRAQRLRSNVMVDGCSRGGGGNERRGTSGRGLGHRFAAVFRCGCGRRLVTRVVVCHPRDDLIWVVRGLGRAFLYISISI